MKKSPIITLLVLSTFILAPFLGGCEESESDAPGTALLGAAVGAGIGALAGGGDGAAIGYGAAAGAGAGYLIGNESDKSKQRQRINQQEQRISDIQRDQNTVTVWVTNSNGSQIPVRLTKDGPGYIGPRGERYPNMPTEEQLKQVYGF